MTAAERKRWQCANRLIGSTAFASLILSGAAWCQSVDAVVREFGFVGRWATNSCDRPASTENWYRTIAVSAAEVSWTESCGNCTFGTVKYVVRSAKRSGDSLDLLVERVDAFTGLYKMAILKSSNRLRTMFNGPLEGPAMVRDGIGSGRETPWFTKCF